jgi:hypothetical protein
VLKLAGIEPRGFVTPGYAYTPALHETLGERFHWWAALRAGALVSGSTLRLDLRPSDLDHPNHMLALEWVLKRSASGREAVTYDELASAAELTFGSTPRAPRTANLTPTRRTTAQ